MVVEDSKGYLYGLSHMVGTTEPALKLLMTVLAGKNNLGSKYS